MRTQRILQEGDTPGRGGTAGPGEPGEQGTGPAWAVIPGCFAVLQTPADRRGYPRAMADMIRIVVLTAVVVIAIIGLIWFAVRLAHRPRNTLLGGALSPELVSRAREIKESGQFDEAVFLIRGETGMSQRSAARLVRRL
ncbi:hypothetical protein Pta02_75440 [Planobispora takensis]|uniref:Uncharacterized protein n=2 Tax=Planobispora takensis TaxID=1367882 RepID=A0A8J3T6X7_9ACTN|nr:hypothetical protein Pta02_75440 [Planobispora takensis]